MGELGKALAVDQHGIEPIPDGDRDSTAWEQFWIWFGANISPLQWVAGAIGPQLGLSLIQSIAIMVVGQAAGALIFGAFTLMGKRTGVSQFTSRPDGVRSPGQQHPVHHQRPHHAVLDRALHLICAPSLGPGGRA